MQTKKLNAVLWMCRRGMLELDLVLNNFARNNYNQLSQKQKNDFLILLTYDDTMLNDILILKTQTAEQQMQEIITLILKAHN